jgi:hypothetical protein
VAHFLLASIHENHERRIMVKGLAGPGGRREHALRDEFVPAAANRSPCHFLETSHAMANPDRDRLSLWLRNHDVRRRALSR